jgi:hypothetical protein
VDLLKKENIQLSKEEEDSFKLWSTGQELMDFQSLID